MGKWREVGRVGKDWLNMKNHRRSVLEARTFSLDSSFKYEETRPKEGNVSSRIT